VGHHPPLHEPRITRPSPHPHPRPTRPRRPGGGSPRSNRLETTTQRPTRHHPYTTSPDGTGRAGGGETESANQERRHLPSGDRIVGAEPRVLRWVAAARDPFRCQPLDVHREGVAVRDVLELAHLLGQCW